VTQAVVEAANVANHAAGQERRALRVLDVACGSGEPSISMAALLKGAGQVVGVDMAAEPLKVARERARLRGLENVEYLQADVHALPFADASFDRVTSRLGIMFFGDLPKALREMHRVLKPGGQVALLTWGAMEQPYFESTIGTIQRARPELEIPAAARAMFKFGVPGTLAAALGAAGFGKIDERVRGLRWDWHGSPEEMWEYFRSITVPFRALLEKVEGDAEVERAVVDALRARFDGEYVRFEAQMVVATAVKE
jgi:ubiquinone/menaquinone biosynthesis C-methylase UbiE